MILIFINKHFIETLSTINKQKIDILTFWFQYSTKIIIFTVITYYDKKENSQKKKKNEKSIKLLGKYIFTISKNIIGKHFIGFYYIITEISSVKDLIFRFTIIKMQKKKKEIWFNSVFIPNVKIETDKKYSVSVHKIICSWPNREWSSL